MKQIKIKSEQNDKLKKIIEAKNNFFNLFKENYKKQEILNEYLNQYSNILYHYTNFKNFTSIVEKDRFVLSTISTGDVHSRSDKYPYYLSLTRVKDSLEGYSHDFNKSGVRIAFNVDDLQKIQNATFTQFSFFVDNFNKVSTKQQALNAKRYSKFNQDVENEERLISAEKRINNVSQYISYVDLLIDMDNPFIQNTQKKVEKLKELNYLFNALKTSKLYTKVRCFTNADAFRFGNEEQALSVEDMINQLRYFTDEYIMSKNQYDTSYQTDLSYKLWQKIIEIKSNVKGDDNANVLLLYFHNPFHLTIKSENKHSDGLDLGYCDSIAFDITHATILSKIFSPLDISQLTEKTLNDLYVLINDQSTKMAKTNRSEYDNSMLF